MLPGPPSEMNFMFEKYVVPLIKEDYTIIQRSINLYGIGESTLESQLKEMPIWLYDNIIIATFAKVGDIEIKIIGKGKDSIIVENQINEIKKLIIDRFKQFIFGYNNMLIEEVVYNLLNEKGLKLGLCESCTGGLISSRFTRIPGASNVLDRGIVTYSNQAKMEELNVPSNILNKFGAVSEETAFAMADGLLRKTNLDIVLSITGIAGPDGGSDLKPVGLIYICIIDKNTSKIIKLNINGNRATIQNKAATSAFAEIRKFLID